MFELSLSLFSWNDTYKNMRTLSRSRSVARGAHIQAFVTTEGLKTSRVATEHCVKHCLVNTASNFEAFECDLARGGFTALAFQLTSSTKLSGWNVFTSVTLPFPLLQKKRNL